MRALCLVLFFLLSAYVSRSQLCSGSLGDPVAFIDFGSGLSQQGPPLAPGKTNYNFVTGFCPSDGSYAVSSTSNGCFNNTWHVLTEDHTPGDINGYMMIVNADRSPGIFYVDTVRGLCGGTVYELSAWVLNILRPFACDNAGIQPDLTFTIETLAGQALATYNTGRIPAESTRWVQYGTFLTTPAGVSELVLRIRNNAPGGCGNDLVLDDIAFRPCGPRVNAGIESLTTKDTSICQPSSKIFDLRMTYTSQYQSPQFQWQENINGAGWNNIPGATRENYQRPVTDIGVFQYRVLIGDGANINLSSCRITSDPLTIRINPRVTASVSLVPTVCIGSSFTLLAQGGATYQWTGPNGFSSSSQSPSVFASSAADAGRYMVKAISTAGCSDTSSVQVSLFPKPTLVLDSSAFACPGKPTTLNASGGNRIRWAPATGLSSDTVFNPQATLTGDISYSVSISNNFGCTDTGRINVRVAIPPRADAGPDIKMLRGKPVQPRSLAAGSNISVDWSPPLYLSDPRLLRPLINPPSDIRYRLTVTSRDGCGSSSDEVEVKVFDELKIPNTFTPNGDGYNDVWQMDQLRGFESVIIEVYNTAGQLVYRDVGYSRPWDGRRNGRDLPAGTYYYVIDTRWEELGKLSGYVTIIR